MRNNGNSLKCSECEHTANHENALRQDNFTNHFNHEKMHHIRPSEELYELLIKNYQEKTYQELCELLKITHSQLLALINFVNKKFRLKTGSDILPKKKESKDKNLESLKKALSKLNIEFEVAPNNLSKW
jgi:hypothetical protein